MKKLVFHIADSQEMSFTPKRLINAGYTGRNQADVQAHVEELKKVGIAAPERVPCFFPKSPLLIQQGGKIHPIDRDCSGEAEFVLLVTEEGWYITAGCDVFDFQVEGFRCDKSKCLYPNILAFSAWRYEEIQGHWDELMLRSWIGPNRQTLYQEGSLAQIMPVEHQIAALTPYLKDGLVAGTVLSGGSLPCLVEGMPYTDCFSFELEDPVLNRKIEGVYQVDPIAWFQR